IYAFADFPQGILTSFLGLLVGLLIFLLPYSLGYIGAGDVKLMAAIGALSNWRSMIAIALVSAIFGGLLVIIIKSFRGGVWRTLKRTGRLFVFALLSLVMVVSSAPVISQKREKYRVETTATEEDYIPYALAIALGTITVIVLSWTGVLTGFVI
ncbi:MAG: prepilin peptidase, partial [Eubacteriales bacterium]|nr:prepilin peptidase [Eubacteriales bacterium]